MSTMDLDDLRWALHDYLMGRAQSNQARMRDLADRPWRLAARIEQLHRWTGLVSVFDDQVLAAVAAGELDVGAEARHLAFRLAELDADSLAERGVHEASAAPEALADLQRDAPPEVLALMTVAVADIAARRLGHRALTPDLAAALGDAFVAGWHAVA